ncbi:hypothetical protein [Nakamurella endophytica]|uniref:Uncharacterized protein n=1 Tax=Nakamurella endophytica TaxID=1748367 RepID=A0A917SM58_9ACTN|nr:hypothetical protein [Nakamurella endophytica]GGL87828.1 hypothetical protein GCM10011594_04370 [Nakamurella endophytica]
MFTTTSPARRPSTDVEPGRLPRTSSIRRLAAGAGMVLLFGGFGVAVAAPAQAATPAPSPTQQAGATATDSSDMSYCWSTVWQPDVDYSSCPDVAEKG